jgi:tetratricopeptide (TPR) repeat protein
MIKLDPFLILLIALWHFSFDVSVSSAFDYFTARQEGQGLYLDTATKNHVDVVPNWLRQGRIGNAIDDLKYTLDRFPNHPKALQYLSLVSKLTKNIDLAILYYQKALSQYPQYAMTHAQYGQYLLSIGDVNSAIESLKRAVEIEPKLVGGYVLLAQAYSKQGNSELAAEAAAQAKELGYKGSLSGIEGSK